MARFTLTAGACPVCDRDVTRIVHTQQGESREIFQCPAHGRLEYGPGQVPLDAMGHGAITTPSSDGLLVSQPLTGLELVY